MSWQIDPMHSRVGFSVRHMMISSVKGHFERFTGTLTLDTTDLTRSQIDGEVEVTSISTNDSQRDDHLRSADFFDVAKFPTMRFRSQRIEKLGQETYRVHGHLTIRDVTRDFAFEVEASGPAKDPWGNVRMGFSASGSLDRKDYGLTWNSLLETGGVMVGEKIKIEIDLEVIQQTAAVPEVAIV